MSDLRENVKAIIATGCGCDRACEQTGDCGCSRDADAAIAIALEEAARVAEGNGLRQYTGKPLIDEIAAAIRALIPSAADPSSS